MPGSFMSSTNLPSPVRSLRSSFLFKGCPIHNPGSSVTSFVRVDNPILQPQEFFRWLGSNFSSPHLLRSCLDRLYDVDIASAPTKVTIDSPTNLLVSRVGVPLQEEECRHQHSRGTEAALQSVVFPVSLLDWMKVFTFCQPLHGQDTRPLGLNREHHARFNGLAIHDYRARATMSSIAAYVRACEIQHISEEVDEQSPRLRRAGVRLSVHLASDLNEIILLRELGRLHGSRPGFKFATP